MGLPSSHTPDGCPSPGCGIVAPKNPRGQSYESRGETFPSIDVLCPQKFGSVAFLFGYYGVLGFKSSGWVAPGGGERSVLLSTMGAALDRAAPDWCGYYCCPGRQTLGGRCGLRRTGCWAALAFGEGLTGNGNPGQDAAGLQRQEYLGGLAVGNLGQHLQVLHRQ